MLAPSPLQHNTFHEDEIFDFTDDGRDVTFTVLEREFLQGSDDRDEDRTVLCTTKFYCFGVSYRSITHMDRSESWSLLTDRVGRPKILTLIYSAGRQLVIYLENIRYQRGGCEHVVVIEAERIVATTTRGLSPVLTAPLHGPPDLRPSAAGN